MYKFKSSKVNNTTENYKLELNNKFPEFNKQVIYNYLKMTMSHQIKIFN